MVRNQIKELKSFELDFDKIRSQTYANIESKHNELKMKKRKIHFNYYIKLAIYSLAICAISVFAALSINNMYGDSGIVLPSDINPGKESKEYLRENFDEFVAFGSGNPSQLFTIEMISKSDLINSGDIKQLNQFLTDNRLADAYCNMYFGTKNGVDIVQIHVLTKPYKVFEFELKLNYKLSEIVEEFEKLSGGKISNEFLTNSCFDDILKEETEGIIIKFNSYNGLYQIYFKASIDGKIYTVNK